MEKLYWLNAISLSCVEHSVYFNRLSQSGFNFIQFLLRVFLYSNGPLLCVGTTVMEMEYQMVKNSEISIVPGGVETSQPEPRIYPVQVMSSSSNNSLLLLFTYDPPNQSLQPPLQDKDGLVIFSP